MRGRSPRFSMSRSADLSDLPVQRCRQAAAPDMLVTIRMPVEVCLVKPPICPDSLRPGAPSSRGRIIFPAPIDPQESRKALFFCPAPGGKALC